jgi:FG-GAP repeat
MAFINFTGLDLSGNLSVEPLVVGPEFSVVQQSKILSTGKLFGYIVASDNSKIIVGAYNSSKAFIFKYDGTVWSIEAELTDTGRFGFKGAIAGEWAAITNSPVSGNGSVFIYRFVNGKWQLSQTITTPDTTLGAGFGWSVAMQGTTMVIGHRQANTVGGAHVYVLSGSTWVKQGGLLSVASAGTRAASNQNFGIDVTVYNDTLVVGGCGDTTGRGLGMAFMSKRTGTTWSAPVLIQPDTTYSEGYGWVVKLKENTLVVGAPYGNTTAGNPGRVFLYNTSGSTPSLTNTFTVKTDKSEIIQDTAVTSGDYYGWSVDINSALNVLAVGSVNRNGNRGAVYIYEKFNNKWMASIMPNSRIDAADATANARFGSSLAFTQNGLIIGAYGINAFYWFK